MAFIASFALHLLFVTAVEAAVFIGKVFGPSSGTPLITFWDNTQRILHSPSFPHLPANDVSSKSAISAPQGGQGNPAPTAVPPNGLEALGMERSEVHPKLFPSLGQALKSFKQFQDEMDGRIKRVKNELVTSEIADSEKIPLQARKETIPAYLQKMRVKIAGRWSRSIQSLGEESAVATVRFRIHQEGTISALAFVSGSSGEGFKRSCLAAVIQASPFEPLPFTFDSLVGERYLTIVLTFHLRKTGSGVQS